MRQKRENQRDYLNWLAEKLRFERLASFYQLTADQIQKNSGSGLINANETSPVKVRVPFRVPSYEVVAGHM